MFEEKKPEGLACFKNYNTHPLLYVRYQALYSTLNCLFTCTSLRFLFLRGALVMLYRT